MLAKQHSALLIIGGPDGELHERPLDRAADVRAAQMLAAHINALAGSAQAHGQG